VTVSRSSLGGYVKTREFFETVKADPPLANTPSMADELKKLSDLFQGGALTEDEYKAAKAKLLQN
jgi:hypothetical protein